MPNKDGTEIRSMPVMKPEEDGHVRGYATTFEQPYVLFEEDGVKFYEVISRHALDGADMSDVVMLHNHTGMLFARTRNGSLKLSIDDHGLAIDADMTLTPHAQEHRQAIAVGLVDRMSWRFRVKKDSYDRATRTRRIEEIEYIKDVSTVDFPANNESFISARDYFSAQLEEERQEILKQDAIERKKQKIKILLEV
mgnify:CR=1 FL=1